MVASVRLFCSGRRERERERESFGLSMERISQFRWDFSAFFNR